MGSGISPDCPLDEATEKLIRNFQPSPLARSEIGRLANKDKCFLELQDQMREAMAIEVPTAEQIQSQFRQAVRAYLLYHRMKYRRRWKDEAIRVARGALNRRLMELTEREESRLVHDIQLKLGIQFLEKMPRDVLTPKNKSRLRSEKPKGTSPSRPAPSDAPERTSDTESPPASG